MTELSDRHAVGAESVPSYSDVPVHRLRLIIGAVLCAQRKPLGLSQHKLAESAGCNRMSVSRVENGAYSPSLDRIFTLADALETSLSDLFVEVDRGVRRSGPGG